MNYLAHLFLSGQNEDWLIGNFIADSIRNKDLPAYSPAIQQGVFLHRQIDSFTDNHPVVLQSTRRLYPHHAKYSPVVIDIFFDHLLAVNWQLYSEEPLRDFSARMYQILQERKQDLPFKLKKRVPAMIEADWLMQYGTERGLQYTFERMADRTRFPSNFENALTYLKRDFSLFMEEFNRFFPDVQQMAFNFKGMDK